MIRNSRSTLRDRSNVARDIGTGAGSGTESRGNAYRSGVLMARKAPHNSNVAADDQCEWCGRPPRSSSNGRYAVGLRAIPLRHRSGVTSFVAEILKHYEPEEVNWSEVARRYNVSRQAVHQSVRRLTAPQVLRPGHDLGDDVPLHARHAV